MPIWLDKRYVSMIAPKLQQFKWKKPTLANFRCPFCGDSQKNKRKARGYLYTKGNAMFYKCHNCPESTNFSNFLKFVEPALHLEYLRETYMEKNTNHSLVVEVPQEKKKVQEFIEPTDLKLAMAICLLPETHYAYVYLKNRLIKEFYLSFDVFFTDNLREFVHANFTDVDHEIYMTDPHILIAIHNIDGKIIGFNARSMKPQNRFAKYVKVKVAEDVTLIFGLERMKKDDTIHVFEGEFNAMFIDNSIAVGGVNMMFGIENIIGVNRESIVMHVDNDPRNVEVTQILEKLIDKGYKVVIYPSHIASSDMNDLVREHKLSSTELNQFVSDNTYSGLSAKLKFTDWRKCATASYKR